MSLEHYGNRTNLRVVIEEYNRWFPMQYYFRSMMPKEKRVRIADLGAGIVSTIGRLNGRHQIRVKASDILQPEYAKILYKKRITLLTPMEYQDMQALTYTDNSFDIVHCVNALDHLKNVAKAISEMKRICKVGGWVYLRHHPDQRTNYGGHHMWDAKMDCFIRGKKSVSISEFTTVQDGDFIISRWQKNGLQ